ncbi:hypothetical protein [Dactylosporangium sp. NPDC051541]|uniref:hypothetical protein n=1 Tax=Dactylosporangium sp. NPDC051541 TaxID=3363977 RepID=UPI0037AC33A6
MVKHRFLRTMLTFAVAGIAALGIAAQPAQAATQSPYPNALVEYMASTRTGPYVNSGTYWGYALRQSYAANAPRQTVAVGCWWDGDWATGNYSTNRWFRVLVWESYDGYDVPRWLFVHASYVYNQPTVPHCIATSTGIWNP